MTTGIVSINHFSDLKVLGKSANKVSTLPEKEKLGNIKVNKAYVTQVVLANMAVYTSNSFSGYLPSTYRLLL